MAASNQRVELSVMTLERNKVNQGRQVNQPSSRDDEDLFFAEIDAPLSKVCAACGERVLPKTTKTIVYSAEDPRFKLLEVNSERGLILAGIHSADGEELVTFCARCDRSLSHQQVPRFSAASGYAIGSVPLCLSRLNAMEARMIGIGVCFTTCFTLGPLGQSATRGNSINFWNDVCDVVTKLPRPADECGVIRLKRPGPAVQETYYNVRPWYLREALMWLKGNNPIYRGIIINEELLNTMPPEPSLPECEIDEAECGDEGVSDDGIGEAADTFTESFVLGHEPNLQREEDKILGVLSGSQRDDQAYILSRHDKPMNEYETKLLMQSCFPTIFPNGLGGFHPIQDFERRKHTYKLAEYCSHMMAWHDRRYVMHPSFKFFCLNLVQRRQIDGLLTQVKGKRGSQSDDTQLADENTLVEGASTSAKRATRQYLQDLKPYFRSVRGTSLYWSNVRDDVMSMIGNPAMKNAWPTFFVTLSAADTIWPDFFRVCDPNLTFTEAANLSPSTKRKYLNENPDLAANHFHRRFQAFFQHILCGKSRPLGEIVDYFWRIEFQHRGSPHVHALLWIAGAPDILELSKTEAGLERLRCFADAFVSCFKHYTSTTSTHELGGGDPLCRRPPPATEVQRRACDLESVVDRVQQHVCSSRSPCQRNGKCRFDFPKPIRDETVVTRETTKGVVEISFNHRRGNDATNNYNATMLSTWRANMDIKIIGNAYGAAEYVAAYVSKAEPDSVRFYRTIERALSSIPSDVPRERILKRTANTLLAIREVSAQETVYILSNTLCLYGKSRTVLKVKVSRHNRRYYRVPQDQLSSTAFPVLHQPEIRLEDVEVAYIHRPATPLFERLTFREFCESFELSKSEPAKGQQLERWKRLDDRGYIKSRRQKQLVRPSPRYRTDEGCADYCYAQLFLLRPWRELADIPVDDDAVIGAYRQWKDRGTSPWLAHLNEEAERTAAIAAAEEARHTSLALPSPHWSIGLDDQSVSQSAVPSPVSTPFQSRFQYSDEDIARAKTFLKDVVVPYRQQLRDNSPSTALEHPYLYPTDDQQPAMTSDQWKPFAVCMSQSRRRAEARSNGTDCSPLHMIICGEGGTGKSWLIRHIIQDLGVVFGTSESKRKVQIMAHQGSAAFLVGGKTISSALAFKLTCNFRSPYERLASPTGSQASLQRLQAEYEDVHLVIVDEFGTVSSGMLHWIDRRLREIFPAHQDSLFGGRDMIFTGDPGQLGPVKPSALALPEASQKTYAEIEGRKLWESIKLYFSLKQQNRGQSDPEWFQMLGRVRQGLPQPGDIDLVNSRVLSPPTSRKNATYLAYRNIDVDQANVAALRAHSTTIRHIHAHHEVHIMDSAVGQGVSQEGMRMLLEEAPDLTSSQTSHLPARLDLAIGAPVTLTYNMEQRLGLCNGSRGFVYDIIEDRLGPQPIVLVRMRDYKGPSFVDGVGGVIPILCQSATLLGGKRSSYRLSRTALPLRLGFTSTIHKSQGQTCETVVLNPTSIRDSALVYVALSRARHRSDVFIAAPLDETQLQKEPPAREIEEKESARVLLSEERTTRMTTALVSEMKAEAWSHNRRTLALSLPIFV